MKSVLVTIILYLVLNEAFCILDNKWLKFKTKFNKKYKSLEEDQRKFKTFKNNIREINRHNQRFIQGLETFEKGITLFADLTKKQFDKKYGLRKPRKMIKYNKVIRNRNKPSGRNEPTEHFDWRDRGAVTSIKKQGVCGACWIFSATGMLEGYNFIKTGQLISLSEQNVVDCFSNTSCKGGFPGQAIMYVKENGISKEADYRYKQKQDTCKNDKPKIKIDFHGYDFLNNTEEELKHSLATYGPLGISLYVSGKWRLYKRGVWYESECSNMTNHAVLLVGYGTENGEDYWLIKNTWGTLWGEDGYIKIARNKHKNYCGLTNEAMYVY